jgi:hypothetical protein
MVENVLYNKLKYYTHTQDDDKFANQYHYPSGHNSSCVLEEQTRTLFDNTDMKVDPEDQSDSEDGCHNHN